MPRSHFLEKISDFFFSPLSIYSALALAFAGSKNKCYEEFLGLLNLTEQPNIIKVLGNAIQAIFDQDTTQALIQANGVFFDGRLTVLENFKKALRENFAAEFQEVSRIALKNVFRLISRMQKLPCGL